MRIFPNRESVIRLARGPAHGKGRQMDYRQVIFDVEEYFTWRESKILSQTHKVTRIF